MNCLKYKITKEEYLQKTKLRVNGIVFKLVCFWWILSIVVILFIFIPLLIKYNYIIDALINLCAIFFIISLMSKKRLIIIRKVKYEINNTRDKLIRKIEWDNENFKIYNNKKNIINSYKDVKNLIESDKIFIINYNKKYKKSFNIIVPKEELYKLDLFDKFRSDVIKNIGENNYKKINIKFNEIHNITKKEYIIIGIIFILALILLCYFILAFSIIFC